MRITDSKRSKGSSPLSKPEIGAFHASEASSSVDRRPTERSTEATKVTDRWTVFGARSPEDVDHR